MTKRITKERILERLPTETFGRNLFFFQEIDSTNVLARTLAETGADEGTVVWAEFQTAGKGRLGRSWSADPENNLTFSVILRDIPEAKHAWVPYYVSEAVAGGIEKTIDIDIASKWPNDLLAGGKKVCGMLLEGNDDPEQRYVVAGIGINVNQARFAPDLEHTATSLLLEHRSPVDRIMLFHAIIENLEALWREIRTHGDHAITEAWTSRCSTFGMDITVHAGSEKIDGKAIGLSKDGGLIVETDGGLRTLFAGDVTLAREFPGKGTV